MRSFSYTPGACFSEVFLLHSLSWFEWGVSLTLLELVMWGVSLTLLELVMWGVCFTLLELVLVNSFSYTPGASFCEEFLGLHSARAGFTDEFLLHSRCQSSEEFLLHSWCLFLWGVSLTLRELVLLRSFPYTPDASFREEFLLHSWSWF